MAAGNRLSLRPNKAMVWRACDAEVNFSSVRASGLTNRSVVESCHEILPLAMGCRRVESTSEAAGQKSIDET